MTIIPYQIDFCSFVIGRVDCFTRTVSFIHVSMLGVENELVVTGLQSVLLLVSMLCPFRVGDTSDRADMWCFLTKREVKVVFSFAFVFVCLVFF